MSCKTCRNWGEHPVVMEDRKPCRVIEAYISTPSDPFISMFTSPDFGCIEHKAKGVKIKRKK